MGSTLLARRAGSQLANRPAAIRIAIIRANATGSKERTPATDCCRTRAAANAAAAPATHVFMLMGTLVMLPIIFGYTIFVYWIFSGKLREGEGYH